MAAIVERDDASAVLLQLRHPGRIHPVHVLGRCKAMYEQNRIALAFVEICDFNSAVMKTRHRSFHVLGKDGNRGWPKTSRFSRRSPPPAEVMPPSAFATAAP